MHTQEVPYNVERCDLCVLQDKDREIVNFAVHRMFSENAGRCDRRMLQGKDREGVSGEG